jgi:cytochrome P450
MESLRLFSFGITARVAQNDDYIDGVFVPKGTLAIIPVRRPSFF